jgi:hypothetical protein
MSYFPLAVGNEWSYHSEIHSAASREETRVSKVTGVETIENVRCHILEVRANEQLTVREYLDLDDEGLFVYRREMGDSTVYVAPPEQRLKFPLTAGRTWTWEGDFPGIGVATIEFEVKAEEDVQVPAGDFKAIKIVATIFQKDLLEAAEIMQSSGMEVEVEPICVLTRWLAQDVGIIKETFETENVLTTRELTSYSIAP